MTCVCVHNAPFRPPSVVLLHSALSLTTIDPDNRALSERQSVRRELSGNSSDHHQSGLQLLETHLTVSDLSTSSKTRVESFSRADDSPDMTTFVSRLTDLHQHKSSLPSDQRHVVFDLT